MMINIGEKIAELRKKKGITQEDLANTIGVSAQSVSKWENSVTMPDIMLLPVIAEIFETSIDVLFGSEVSTPEYRSFPLESVVDEAYDAVIRTTAKVWCDFNFKDGMVMDFEKLVKDTKAALADDPRMQTVIITDNSGVVYSDHVNGSVVLKRPRDGFGSLLEDKSALECIDLVSDANCRRILVHMVRNYNAYTPAPKLFTISSIVKKCGIDEAAALPAIEKLERFGLIVSSNIELDSEDGESKISVYQFAQRQKMFYIYIILGYAKRMTEHQGCYYGYRGAELD